MAVEAYTTLGFLAAQTIRVAARRSLCFQVVLAGDTGWLQVEECASYSLLLTICLLERHAARFKKLGKTPMEEFSVIWYGYGGACWRALEAWISRHVHEGGDMKKALYPLAASLPLVMSAAGVAHAGDDITTLQASLAPLNDSGASGSATVVVTGNTATVSIESQGLVAALPHAQHFHIGGTNTCPTEAADENNDGRLSTTEGLPSYGPIQASLTTQGDTSPDSGLAVDRMPIADGDGNVSYRRTFALPDGVAADVRAGRAVIVQHGVDHNGNGEYDGEAESDLDPSLPAEATDPAACGELNRAPSAVEAGGGGAAGDGINYAVVALGATLLAAAAGGAFALRRVHGTR